MQYNAFQTSPGFGARDLSRFQRTDVPVSGFPSMRGGGPRRRLDIPDSQLASSGGFAIATEWLGRLAAVMAIVLFGLVLICIHKGKLVQESARTVVDNFVVTNDMFAERADLTAPATARRQLDELAVVLTRLNEVTAADVDHLGSLLPDAQVLLAAGQGDVEVAGQLEGVATTLRDAAGSLNRISTSADQTVTAVDNELIKATDLVNALNFQLTRTTNKVALIPAQDAFIPAPVLAPAPAPVAGGGQ